MRLGTISFPESSLPLSSGYRSQSHMRVNRSRGICMRTRFPAWTEPEIKFSSIIVLFLTLQENCSDRVLKWSPFLIMV